MNANGGRGVALRFDRMGHTFQGVKGQVEAVKDFTLDMKPGEFVVVVGPSGCGKSTLLHAAAGLVKPTSGRVLVGDREVDGPDSSRILVFQQAMLFPWLTVRGNVAYGLARAKLSRAKRRQRALEVLKLVQLEAFAKHRVHELSGGMQQRVALARALALEPKVLLMDEPFAALDAQTREELQARVEELWQREKPTILFVTHDVHEAARLADRIVVMSHRPGTAKRIMDVSIPRPRAFDDEQTARVARETREALAEEVAWSRERELAWP